MPTLPQSPTQAFEHRVIHLAYLVRTGRLVTDEQIGQQFRQMVHTLDASLADELLVEAPDAGCATICAPMTTPHYPADAECLGPECPGCYLADQWPEDLA